jgi:hypothetical protein
MTDWMEGYGTVTRHYSYFGDAVSEVESAQDLGWTIHHVFVHGKRLEPIDKSSWLKELWSPRLIRHATGRVSLRRQPSFLNGRSRYLLNLAEASVPEGGMSVSEADRVEVVFTR